MTVQQRKTHVQSSSLCANCLHPGHTLKDCQCSFRCRICKQQHNTLLHTDSNTTTGTVNTVTQTSQGSLSQDQRKEKLLMTSQVLLTGSTGKKMVVRALLDPGAEVSILFSRVMKNLQLKRLDEWMTLKGIESPETSPARPTAMVTVSSLHNKDWSQSVKVTVLPKVDTDLPKEHLQFVKDMPHIKDLCLADPYFHQPRRVDIILDVAFTDDVLLAEKIVGPPGTPTAWKTELGWGVRGRYVTNDVFNSPAVAMHTTAQKAEEVRMDQILEKFLKLDPQGTTQPICARGSCAATLCCNPLFLSSCRMICGDPTQEANHPAARRE